MFLIVSNFCHNSYANAGDLVCHYAFPQYFSGSEMACFRKCGEVRNMHLALMCLFLTNSFCRLMASHKATWKSRWGRRGRSVPYRPESLLDKHPPKINYSNHTEFSWYFVNFSEDGIFFFSDENKSPWYWWNTVNFRHCNQHRIWQMLKIFGK